MDEHGVFHVGESAWIPRSGIDLAMLSKKT